MRRIVTRLASFGGTSFPCKQTELSAPWTRQISLTRFGLDTQSAPQKAFDQVYNITLQGITYLQSVRCEDCNAIQIHIVCICGEDFEIIVGSYNISSPFLNSVCVDQPC